MGWTISSQPHSQSWRMSSQACRSSCLRSWSWFPSESRLFGGVENVLYLADVRNTYLFSKPLVATHVAWCPIDAGRKIACLGPSRGALWRLLGRPDSGQFGYLPYLGLQELLRSANKIPMHAGTDVLNFIVHQIFQHGFSYLEEVFCDTCIAVACRCVRFNAAHCL